MTPSELPTERALAAAFHIRSEITDHVKALATNIVENATQIACEDRLLFDNMLGNGIGMSIIVLIEMLGRKHPGLLEQPANCVENWLECISRGINATKETCECDQCQRERL